MLRLTPREALRRVLRRKRAMVLLLLGGVFILTGYVQLDTADLIRKSPLAAQSYAAHIDVMPMSAWGWVFIVVGLVAAVSGFAGRIPAWVGFASLQLLSTFWGSLFIASYYQTHFGRAWVGVLQWAMVVGLLGIIADWDDPPAADLDAIRRVLDGKG